MAVFGHVLSNKEIKNLIVTEKLQEKRGVGRPKVDIYEEPKRGNFTREISD